jgi:dTDP-glucose 4,6-dehydratase
MIKNLLVTGGCGFIGTNFIHYLLDEAGFAGRVINLDVLTYAGNPANLQGQLEREDGRYLFVQADICDAQAVGAAMDRYEVDAVCHLAAESHVDRSIRGPAPFIQTNLVGTYTLLEAARARADRMVRFHHVSTDEVFGSLGPQGHFTEETAYSPNSPYSATKAGSDHLVRAYQATFGLPITVSNCSNNYGPYQFPEKLLPLMLLNAAVGEALPVYGDGLNVRDWLHVRDHCVALYEVLTRGEVGRTYNVGGGAERTNIELVTLLCDMLDARMASLPDGRARRELITFVEDRPGHDRRYAVDASRIKQELGWSPAETLESGLEQTVRWYLDNPKWVEMVRSGEYLKWIEQHYDGTQ